MQLFYEPDFESNGYHLGFDESKHCVKVLRHKNGDQVTVMNGQGKIFQCQIIDANSKKCALEVLETNSYNKREFSIHMAVAPTKNMDRFEWFLEKATEIGIEEITPIICDHSERKIIKPERLIKVIVSASKQSLKSYIPKLNEAVNFKEFISVHKSNNQSSYIAHCAEGSKKLLKNIYNINSDVTILIGPEGDFSTLEIELASQHNYEAISLGKERLRTETAALMSCATINFINQVD